MTMGNYFDQFDGDKPAGGGNFFDQFDESPAGAKPTATDYLKGAASGVGGLVSGIGYLAERAGANQVGGDLRFAGDEAQKAFTKSMTPAGQRAAQSQVFEDDPVSALPKVGDRWGQALAMGAAQSAPSVLAAAIPGGIAAAGLRGAAGMAASRGIGGALAPLAAGTAAPIGGWATNLAGNLAARVPTALGFGAAEGAVAGASNAAQWKSDIEQKPLAELRKMPGFAALEAQIGEQAARQQIAEQGAADIMARTTLATGGIGALTGGGALGSAFQRVTTGAKGGILGAIGRDAAKEAGQEIPQSGGERAIQNIATRDYLDPSQSITQGVLADALSGGAIGGVMGGVTGGGSHLAKGPLQKAVEASSATIPPDAGIAAGIPAGNAGNAGIPFSQQQQNTPAAPGLSPDPVPAAESSLPTNQAEPAGVTVSQQQQGLASSGNQTEVAKPAEQGQQAQPAAPADTAAEWDQFVRTEGADVGTRRLGLIGQQRRDAADLAGLASAEAADLGPRRVGLMMGQQRAKQAAAKSAAAEASRKGIAAALQTPQQPTTGGGPLPQVATDMPVGKYGIAAAVAQPKAKAATPFVAPTLTTREQPKTTSVLPQQAADMPVGKYGAATRRAEKPADAQKQQKPFVAPRFTAKDQPTTTSVLSQQATEMPVGRFGVAAQKPKEPSGRLYKGIPVDKPAGELTDDELHTISEPDSRLMRDRNAQLARHQGDPRFLVRIPGNLGAWETDFFAVRNFLKDGSLTDRGRMVTAIMESLRSRDARFDDISQVHLAKTAGSVLTAIETGRYNSILHPDNKNSRAVFEQITGIKLPSGVKATQNIFSGNPFEIAWSSEDAKQPHYDTIQSPNGQPFKSQLAARRAASQHGVKDTHDVVPASEVSAGATGFVLRKKPEQKSPARLPPGWTEASPGGIATNKDERTGGIVDVSADGTWFAVANAEGIPTLAGFKSRDDAFAALAAAVERNVRAGSPNASADISPDISPDTAAAQQPSAAQVQPDIGPDVAAAQQPQDQHIEGKSAEPASDAKISYDEASPTKKDGNDPANERIEATVDQPLAEGESRGLRFAPARGARSDRYRPGRADDRGVRRTRRGSDQPVDESRSVGNGSRPSAIQHGQDGALAGGLRRVSADFRPRPGQLTRQGSWFDTAKRNIDLIELAIQIDKEKRNATADEQALLAKYVGFGAGAIRNELFPVPSAWAKSQEPNRLIWPNLVRDARWKPLAERIEALPREWQQSILQSTQYAHYTSEGVIRSIWSAIQRLGFTGGNIFEPGTGIGSFAMLMPDSVRETSLFTGVEFDAPTAMIARLLSPDQQIQHDDFIKRKFPKNYFDVNVGNPPFSQTKILGDSEYAKNGFMLHDFFFAKGIDLVRPGGLQVFVTSKGTMDKRNDRARKFLSDRADLIGAIRLPSTAFEGNAGTSVVTDVIFLKKRANGDPPGGMAWGGLKTIETKDGPVDVNEYFADHPEMVLGQQRISGNVDDMGRRVNSNGYGGEKYTVVSYDSTPEELDAKFAKAIENLPENVYSPLGQSDAAIRAETQKVDFDPAVRREGVVYVGKDGDILRVSAGVGVPLDGEVKLSDKDKAWFKGYVGIRDLVQKARAAQVTDGNWKAALRALNKAYDEFRAEYGPIRDFRTQTRKSTDEEGSVVEVELRVFKNKRLYREDYDSSIILSLESITESGEVVKAPFLLGRTVGKPVSIEVKSIGDALAVSLDSIGKLDLEDIGRRMKLSREETIEALGNQIYKTPSGVWQLADEYLSGDVVTKLEEAEHLARTNGEYRRNVEALKEVQPEKLGPSQISAKLGAAWIPDSHVNEFAREIGAGEVTFDPKTESWQVEGGNKRTERKAGAEYGTAARSPSEILEAVLNSRSIKVVKTEDKKTVTDIEATTAANEMAKKIKDKFKGWVWTDTDRAAELVEAYNKRFNNIAPRKFDGSHLTLPGVSLRFKLHPHQLRSIWRQIQTGNTYLAHAVGAGKTIEMIAGAMEQKRLGLIKKPMFVVPNHMLEQFSNEFMELYPLANIMVADDENFSAERRRAFIASATLNAPDAIIITHSAFKRIGVTEASVAPIRDEILTDLEMELSDLAQDQGSRVRRGQLQQQIEAVSQRFDAIINASGKDSTVKFEDIGADFIYADEAHAFRKLDFHTAQSIKGIDPNGSQAAMDMFVKTRVLEKARPGRSFVFASGTPVTNTMGELFTIMRFFNPREMDKDGISTFDSWARQFGEVAPALEPNAAGKYELIERFAKFDNVPELMSRIRQFMDVLTSESLGALVKRPDLIGGKPHLNIVEPTDALNAYMKNVLAPRIEASRAWKPSPQEKSNPDPIVSIITDGRFAAIDPRFFGSALNGESIITTMAGKVAEKYHATKNNVYYNKDGKPEPIKGSTQIVFYNLGFGAQSQINRGFNARAAFTKLLTEKGIPRSEIAWFDDANTDAKKEAIFKDMRSGKLKVLIGSAKKMGTGVNVQNRLIALHYQDPPWFPADVEQPHGRIIRQGNMNPEVSIDWYTTKGTYQSTMWQMVGRKQRFIDQAFTGDKSLRSMDDLGEASLFEQAAAVASGDPRALQLAGLRQDVERFERLQAAHANEQINVRSALRNAEWSAGHHAKNIDLYAKAFKAIGERYFQFEKGDVNGRTYVKAGEFGQALKDEFNRAANDRLMDMVGGEAIQIASLGKSIQLSMEAEIDKNKPTGNFVLSVDVGGARRPVLTASALGSDTDATGLARKVFNQVNDIEGRLRYHRQQLAKEEADIIRLRKKRGAPFEYQQEMAEKYGDLKRLEAELQSEGAAPTAAPDTAVGPQSFAPRIPYGQPAGRMSPVDSILFNRDDQSNISPSDRAIYEMANEGKSTDEILSFLSKASRRPFNRLLATALQKAGLQTTVTADSQGGWQVGNRSYAQKYAAAYSPKADKVALFTPRDAERHVLHELVHAATLRAIESGGVSAMRMRALFKHVQQSGKLDGQYGMSSLDEFVAEVFSNPKFRDALQGVPAPASSALKSVWQWFVRIVARIVGIKTQAAETALDRALRDGLALMEENAAIRANGSGVDRFAVAWHGTPHVWAPEPGFPHGRFRLDKIFNKETIGEGAWAYGAGAYLAESPGVAKSYRDLARAGVLNYAGPDRVKNAAGMLASGVDPKSVTAGLRALGVKDSDIASTLRDARALLRDLGTLYQLDIPDDVLPSLLDWDKPLSEQSPAVQEALRGSAIAPDESTWQHWTGQQLYEGEVRARTEFDGQAKGDARKLTSEQLASIGIPGLRYLDQGSRADGTGTYNYVIWDQKVLDRIALLERNGEKLDAIRAADEAVRFNLDTEDQFAATERKVGGRAAYDKAKAAGQTKLNYRQWVQVRTPAFKAWFGDWENDPANASKVVDPATGEPLVVYHGTDVDFSAFDKDKIKSRFPLSIGYHFTTRPSEASMYAANKLGSQVLDGGNVMSAYAMLLNPLIVDTTHPAASMEADLNSGPMFDKIRAARLSGNPHDGIIIRRDRGDEWDGWNVIAFKPEQIKSATGNRGTFDATDPDIRYNVSGDDYSLQFYDANENPVVWSNDDYRVTVNKLGNATLATLWARQVVKGKEFWGKRGHLSTFESTKRLDGKSKDYLRVQEVAIEREHRGNGLSEHLYHALLSQAKPSVSGILIHVPSITNSVQIPRVHLSLGAIEQSDPDFKVIPRSRPSDIRYNIAADWQTAPTRAATTIRQYVADSMRSDSNTSWLTPFNTQYHKAEKWAAEGKVRFKQVFNIVQQFIADTSRFAVMSQNAAPALLHEIKSLRDVKEMLTAKHGTGKQHRADIEAIASPLYDGTLYGGGNPLAGLKWSDSLLRTKYNLTDRQIKLYHEAMAAVKVSMDEMAKSLVARHAKRVGVDFDNGMALDDMVADVAEKMKELQDDVHFEFLSDEAEQSVAASVEHYLEMDMKEEAKKTQATFKRQQKDAKEKIAEIEKTIADIKAIEGKAVALQEHGYFPLMRFGRHTVTAKDAEGKTLFFGMYDGIPLVPRSGQAEANRVKREVQAMFPDATVETGIINDEKYKLYQGLNLDAMQIFAEHMDKDDLAPVQEFIRLATNSRSAMKRLMHREGTPGFDRDVRRTLAQFIVSNARSAASNYHNADMLRAAEEANKDGGDIGREAVRLVKYIQNPEEEAQVLRGFLFFQFLGGSIASAVVNLTQTPAMTLPFLSKFEPAGRLSRRLLSAAKMAVGDPKDIADVALRDALVTAEMDGVTAPQEIHQLVATAANNLFAGSRTATVFLRGWGAPFAMAESVNRRIAFISAFQIAQGMGKDLKAKTGFATPFEFAEDAVNQTQGLYNKGNRMNVGRGAPGAIVMTFKQFSIMYLELLKRLPPKQRAIMLGVLLISAGGGGLPGVEDAEDIWDTIGQWLGFASNSKRTIRNTLTDLTNPEIADLAINGLLSKMGIDLHSRLGMQNLLPGTAMLKQSSTDKGREITEVFGPAASVIKSVGDALEKLATGQPAGAAKALVPGAIRNAWQGVEMAATGRAEDARGRATVPVNEAESIAKVIGFNPKSVAQRGEVNRGLWQDQRLIEVKREGFTADIVSAILAGDDEAKTEAYDAMRAWNEDNPQHRVTINPATIGKRVREARAEGTARMVRALPKAMRQQAAEEFAR